MMRSPFRTVKRLSLWAALDQSLVSLAGLLIALFAARTLDPSEFGLFALIQGAYWVALGLTRGISSEPLVIHASPLPPQARRGAIRRAGGAAVLGALGISLTCLALTPFLSGRAVTAVLALSCLTILAVGIDFVR